jgi:hypothetical protein
VGRPKEVHIVSTTFLVTLILAVIVLGNLRLFLLIASAFLVALVITGVGTVSGAAASGQSDTTLIAPVQPGPEPDDPGGQSDNSPRAQSEPPR